jgi:RNA polymerase sigma-70 factor (ECF subfamily)
MTDLHKFETFMRNYQDMVYSTAVRLLGHAADAEDISQAVFLKAYEHFNDLATSPTAGGWLKTVATNLCLNHLSRYRARWRFFTDMRREDDESETDFVEMQPAPDAMSQQLAGGDYRALLDQALLKLPEGQRVPLVLYHFEDLDYEQIAARLKVSLAKVKTDIHRGRLALKKHLEPRLADDERWSDSTASSAP